VPLDGMVGVVTTYSEITPSGIINMG